MNKGKFIVVDGGEGSGKGTIIKHLTKVFQGEPVVFSREPGGCEVAEKIRGLIIDHPIRALSELMMFEAARHEHMETFIIPELNSGNHVVCDRFDSSTYAYQICGRGRGVHEELFNTINDIVVRRKPDLYVFCDISPAVALQRRMLAGDVNRFDAEDLEFHERVYQGFKDFFAHRTEGEVRYVDSTLPIEEMELSAERFIREELDL